MAEHTTHYNLVKPLETEDYNVADQNGNMDIIDAELFKRGKTINGNGPDANGDYAVKEVEFARQIVTDDAQQDSGEFLFRSTGGSASLSDGPAMLVALFGRSMHTGVVQESLTLTVDAVPRTDPDEPITASIDRDTFVAYVATSGTITLTYSNAWSANPSLYGVTVTGTPVSGDQIVIVYVKENRGLITNSTPSGFRSTGWNLYDHVSGYARVKKYSSSYGFLIGGTYSAVKFSETESGVKSTITPVSGYFTIPSDGYIWVTGGDDETTYILMTWSDWSEGYDGDWEAYTETEIDLSTIMENFPYGLMQVGSVADEINFSMAKAISRIMRMAYTAENLEDAIASGRPWDADENYIYIVRPAEITYDIEETGDYTACDHGQEIIDGSTVPVFVQTLYGQNLVDKLRTDVVTKSQDFFATEMPMSTSDDTTVSEAISALNSNLESMRSKFKSMILAKSESISFTNMEYALVAFGSYGSCVCAIESDGTKVKYFERTAGGANYLAVSKSGNTITLTNNLTWGMPIIMMVVYSS